MTTPKTENFTVKDLFDRIEKAKGKVTRDLEPGNDLNYVAAKKTNNGIKQRCSSRGIESQISEGNCIVFVCQGDGAAGYTTYQPEPFVGMSTIACGYLDGIMDEDIGLYLVACLDKNKRFFSHSTPWSGDRLNNTILPLPVLCDCSGKPQYDASCRYHKDGYIPDWDYMRTYISEIKERCLASVIEYINSSD